MSKLIVEMEMPTNCKKCPLVRMDHFGQIRCGGQSGRLIHLTNFQTEIERPSWCPIKGVLPDEHGDLIDKSELIKHDNQHYEYLSDEYYVTVRDIKAAPTIVPAERSET